MSEQSERIKELDKLLTQGEKILATAKKSSNPNAVPEVNEEKFHAFRIAALSWLNRVFDTDHTCSRSFVSEVNHATVARTKRAIGILQAAGVELEGNWLPATRSGIAKDMLSSILHHAQREYNDGNLQAAVIICGTVVDELLRRICLKAAISLTNQQLKGRPAAKKALQLTGEAYKKKIFDRTVNKQFITIIELFNEQVTTGAPPPDAKKVAQIIASLQKLLPTLPL